ncbi:hypothetical protein [Parenemella sanctibonifatiensis]|uniref:Uncharacterized protein n=1 Tax=Parenemella sanctibonifatiensis TaxID=2016505 RepID=A0A255ELF8_9ACTN|nr:hypothetical protein [Parenemella sanctibonifatiensis]OYN90292.1 hypothetical protein CGZ91_09030 [Parenemella sanctibonifatiensis]
MAADLTRERGKAVAAAGASVLVMAVGFGLLGFALMLPLTAAAAGLLSIGAAIFIVLAGALIARNWLLARTINRHRFLGAADEDAARRPPVGFDHWCQCELCARTSTPTDAPEPIRRPLMPPAEGIITAVSIIVAMPLVAIVVPGMTVLLQLGEGGFTHLLLGGLLLLLLLAWGVGWLQVVSGIRRRRLPNDHGCTCRWCGAPGVGRTPA